MGDLVYEKIGDATAEVTETTIEVFPVTVTQILSKKADIEVELEIVNQTIAEMEAVGIVFPE